MRYFNHYIFPYTESSSSQQEGGLHEATPEVLHLILTNLLYGPKDQFGNTSYCLCKCGHSSFMFKYILNLLQHVYICLCVYFFFLSFPGIVAETKESFLKSLRRDFPRELVPVVLAPLLYPSKPDLPMDKVNQDNSTMTNTMVSTGI